MKCKLFISFIVRCLCSIELIVRSFSSKFGKSLRKKRTHCILLFSQQLYLSTKTINILIQKCTVLKIVFCRSKNALREAEKLQRYFYCVFVQIILKRSASSYQSCWRMTLLTENNIQNKYSYVTINAQIILKHKIDKIAVLTEKQLGMSYSDRKVLGT